MRISLVRHGQSEANLANPVFTSGPWGVGDQAASGDEGRRYPRAAFIA